MKIILFFHSNLNLLCPQNMGLGGIETAIIELSMALACNGHEIKLLTHCDHEVILNGVHNIPINKNDDYTCDAFISINNSEFLNHTLCSKKILWLHNPINIEKAFRRGMIFSLFKHQPHAVFGSLYAEKQMTNLYPFKSRSVIPLGISHEFLQGNVGRKRAHQFIFASQPNRGLDLTINAWIKALPHLPADASLNIFGVMSDQYQFYAQPENDLRIIFHPRLTKHVLATFYETAFAMIYPGANDETFCLAAAEAQCMGLPVITMGIGSLSERVSTGVNGILCQDEEQFARAIVDLANNPDYYQLLQTGALAQRQTASWDRIAKIWEYKLSSMH